MADTAKMTTIGKDMDELIKTFMAGQVPEDVYKERMQNLQEKFSAAADSIHHAKLHHGDGNSKPRLVA